jgi:putative transposase
MLAAEGHKIGGWHVKTLMRRMGIAALYRCPRTTRPEPGHKIYPNLLGDLAITHTPVPSLSDGCHLYPDGARLRLLALVLDWVTRRVPS